MTKIKFANNLEALNFFNVISLSPAHTWEVYKIQDSKEYPHALELVRPGRYLRSLDTIKIEVSSINYNISYFDLSFFLYEELKRYKGLVLPLYWDRPSLILTEPQDLIIRKDKEEVGITKRHPWYFNYKEVLKIDKRILKDLEERFG